MKNICSFSDGSPPRVWGKLNRDATLKLIQSVHPHACGENSLPDGFIFSSGRFTPTRVGKTLQANKVALKESCSPPRVWGKLSGLPGRAALCRFTPTRVGKTSVRWFAFVESRRFTPTRVGKTCDLPYRKASSTVHPHACGENAVAPVVHDAHGRFTPTRVGKTNATILTAHLLAVHPHACGENACGLAANGAVDRFTPTRVGKTNRLAAPTRTNAVHPHSCGENFCLQILTHFGGGSPPRVWGKRVARFGRDGSSRFTPTRVGKTLPYTTQSDTSSVNLARVWLASLLGCLRDANQLKPFKVNYCAIGVAIHPNLEMLLRVR